MRPLEESESSFRRRRPLHRGPIEVGSSGRKRVDVDRFYDVANYRPKVADVMGMPMFLH